MLIFTTLVNSYLLLSSKITRMDETHFGENMKKLFIALSLLSSLTVANAIDINKLKWTEDFETLINLSSSTENTLKGIDQNKNGVRDDVEYYVNTKYQDKPFQKAMFIKAAGMMQKIITLSDENITEHQKLDHALLNVYACRDYILYKMDNESLEKELQDKIVFKGKVLNTEKRLRAYINHKQLLPFQFDDLNEDQLKKDKTACLNQYNKIKNPDKNLISSTQ